jgi:hypothetical protein
MPVNAFFDTDVLIYAVAPQRLGVQTFGTC